MLAMPLSGKPVWAGSALDKSDEPVAVYGNL
jgi:hypothetical protein